MDERSKSPHKIKIRLIIGFLNCQKGFEPHAESKIYQDPFPDYSKDKKGKDKAKNKKKEKI